jgi:23S rRNA pseudoU1915 N3-methylase RlmH
MKIYIGCIGKLKDPGIKAACHEVLKRLKDVEVLELKDSEKEDESERLSRLIKHDSLTVAIVRGRETIHLHGIL